MRRFAAACSLLLLAAPAGAWPAVVVRAFVRDARRLVPASLARLIGDRENMILAEVERFPPALGQALSADLSSGTLKPETVAALQAHAGTALELFHEHQVGDGIVRLGAILVIPANLSDPVLSVGPEGYPSGVAREYYEFVVSNLEKIPVVLEDPKALQLARGDLPGYWQEILAKSRSQSPVLRTELFQGGRVVDHRTIDFRSPVFGVASLSYSRAVTSIAATWLALWRQARGDQTHMRPPRTVVPTVPPSPLPDRQEAHRS